MDKNTLSTKELLEKNNIVLNCKTSKFANKSSWYYTSVDTAS